MSGRESYGDDAIGYVQLHREHGLCTLKCKMCPEHKVRSKAYNVTMVINENESEIISCQCHDCAASAGGCKHVVAFLMWVHRRSEEPPSTLVECYWKKPTLSRVHHGAADVEKGSTAQTKYISTLHRLYFGSQKKKTSTL
ncbi:unnamed protein product [Acanthoscelides obtectus]|uniref:SWIM-type domain-containing protein n=1 Tax=Acanthoscelides obtectus TaxID=200917 RepID=A0A9P0LPS5_ACAOB|nr:unnamed protein product [Acanthoscelides obtectus]CAK1675161.1 hypothetical protein AOBTE_LOCUS29948 [Acanthoscelides obtectus]